MSIVKSIFKVLRSGTWDEHYFKTSSDQVVHTKTDGQASTVKEQLDGLNSALKWSDWVTLPQNNLGLALQYRYNKHFVEVAVYGTIIGGKNLTYGTDGYKFQAIPKSLKPAHNIRVPIYGCYNNLCVQMWVENSDCFTIMSNKTITTVEEYTATNFVYGI